MYYATHKLYIGNDNPLVFHVVKVEQGLVVDFFPFDGEKQSMLWVDAIVLSDRDDAETLLPPYCNGARPVEELVYAYSLEYAGDVYSLKRLL